jgi:hypothetical protein
MAQQQRSPSTDAHVAAAGAIGTPALFAEPRSRPARFGRQRTFLSTVVSAAVMFDRIVRRRAAGRLLTTFSTRPPDGPIVQLKRRRRPLLMAITLPGIGERHAQWMRELPHLQASR